MTDSVVHIHLYRDVAYVCFIFCFDVTQEMKFSIKDFFSKCDQIRSFLRIWSHLLKKILNGILEFLCSVTRKILSLTQNFFLTKSKYAERL